MVRYLFFFLFSGLFFFPVIAQQINIPRIEKMPDFPTPYLMRDWKQVAIDYDQFVFITSKTGTYLPLTSVKGQGNNYTDIVPIWMDTYVGTNTHGQQAEAINILPAIIGASLNGIDKTNQSGQNWVSKAKDFFNKKNGQNVYLNNYSASSGKDWWYDLMPNVYFYQLYHLYPHVDPDFNEQLIMIADRWLWATYQLGGNIQPWTIPNMNYRAFNLATGQALNSGVREPESAGSIAWLLYHAYQQTNNKKYLEGSQLALDFLQNWTNNPSYELQLPYGTLIAAKMNAIEGTNYDISKFFNWCFDRGALRGWGAIVGRWGNYDVSGLIGEANDQSNDYAFIMNGFQHAAALVPLVKYDKRFARAIGKWMLNLANASRLMYWNALAQENQEPQSYAWASVNDPQACIPYESMKENRNGKKPYAMGDAVDGKWAATNLSLYSGSSVGYMAALIEKTNVEGILQLDLNVTDFFGENTYPTYLYYNSTGTDKNITLKLPANGNYNVYDAVTETTILSNVSNSTSFSIASDNVRILVIYPSGKTIQNNGRQKTVDGKVIDYHAGYDFNPVFRIKAFTCDKTIAESGEIIQLYTLTDNIPSGKTPVYQWFVNKQIISGQSSDILKWTAPENTGTYQLSVKITAGSEQTTDSVQILVDNNIIFPPVINQINTTPAEPFSPSTVITLNADINQPEKITSYKWSVDQGSLVNSNSSSPAWHLPASAGVCKVTLEVENQSGSVTSSRNILIKQETMSVPVPLIYYSFDGNTQNQAQNAFHATLSGATLTPDALGNANKAYRFSSSSNIIYTPLDEKLNFSGQVSLSFWLKADALPDYEQFLISHGSWEERYKVSITPEKKLRWTLKTNTSIVDVDCPTPLETGRFYYFTTIYTGYSMEVYSNGTLVAYAPLSGTIATSNKNITYARKDNTTTDYAFKGALDEIRIYNSDLPQAVIKQLPYTWTLDVHVDIKETEKNRISIYPNPVYDGKLTIDNGNSEKMEIYSLAGILISSYPITEDKCSIDISHLPHGFYLVKTGKEVMKILKY